MNVGDSYPMETKEQIRKRIIQDRNQMPSEDVAKKSSMIAQKVLKTPEYEEAHNILLYADYRHEVMTREIFDDAVLRKKKVYFPKSNADCTMDFYQVVSVKQLESGYKGIKEPVADERYLYQHNRKEDTLIIVPGVAFDMNGYRVGYGKGFYDRFLQDKRQMTVMGLCFSSQIVEEIPHDQYDIRMDKIVTEEIIYSFLRV